MGEKKIPNINDAPAPAVRGKKKEKQKKLLKTPTQIIRWFMIGFYVVAILLLSATFTSFTLFIDDDLEVTSDPSRYYNKLASQEEVDQAAAELQTALSGLEEKKKTETSTSEESSKQESSSGQSDAFFGTMSSVYFNRQYQIAQGIKAEQLDSLIQQGLNLKRYKYTEESLSTVDTALLKAQKVLCTDLIVSQAPLQLIMSGGGNFSNNVANHILMYFLALIPIVGFFIASFNRFGHLKNIYTLIGSVSCIALIFRMFYPYLARGAVFSIFVYMILAGLAIAGMYAKQQEDYIILHPEEEAEFTVKHPHFLKALLNEKTISIMEPPEKDDKKTDKKQDKKPGRKDKKSKKRT